MIKGNLAGKGQVFIVNKLSAGYAYDLPIKNSLQWGMGSLASTYFLPAALHKE